MTPHFVMASRNDLLPRRVGASYGLDYHPRTIGARPRSLRTTIANIARRVRLCRYACEDAVRWLNTPLQ